MPKTEAPATLSEDEAEAMRQKLAAHDALKRQEANAAALAPLLPLKDVFTGKLGDLTMADVARIVSQYAPAIDDKRLKVHLDGFVQITPRLLELYSQILAEYQLPGEVAAP